MFMKVCQSCGCENNDDAERCGKCGTKIEANESIFPTDKADKTEFKFDDPMPVSLKWRFWLGPWLLVVLATMVIHPSQILAAPFFPVGLLVWLPKGNENAIAGWMNGAWIIGWIFYLFLSIIMFQAKKSGVFFLLLAILFVLLVFNVVGCQQVSQAAAGIR
jgi:hypothetical protein